MLRRGLLVVLLLATGCGWFAPRAAIRAQVVMGMRTLAAPKALVDIHHFTLQLYRAPATLAHSHTTPDAVNTAFFFNDVTDGTYYLTAEAFDAGGVSITQGGPQTSANTVTVTGNTVTYSNGGSALVASLTLSAETISGVVLDMIVTPGAAWTGEPVGVP